MEFTVFVDKRLRNIAKLSPDERVVLEPSIPFDGRKIRLTARPKEILTLEIKENSRKTAPSYPLGAAFLSCD